MTKTNLTFFKIGDGCCHAHMGTHQPSNPCKVYEVYWRMLSEGSEAIKHERTPQDFAKNPCLSCKGQLIFMQEQISEALND